MVTLAEAVDHIDKAAHSNPNHGWNALSQEDFECPNETMFSAYSVRP